MPVIAVHGRVIRDAVQPMSMSQLVVYRIPHMNHARFPPCLQRCFKDEHDGGEIHNLVFFAADKPIKFRTPVAHV